MPFARFPKRARHVSQKTKTDNRNEPRFYFDAMKKLLSSLTHTCLRAWLVSRHLAGVIRTSGGKAGLTFLTNGLKVKLPRLLGRPAGGSKQPNEFDRTRGTDTSGRVGSRELGLSPRQAIGVSGYAPTSENRFHALLAKLEINLGDYVFVDCGSGKGLVVLLASQYSFKRIVGVELSPVLHKIAETNLSKIDRQTQRCFDIELVCLDATKYEFPTEPCVVYLYHPFGDEDPMQKVVTNLLRSLTASPHDVIIIYLNPVHVHCLDKTGRFKRLQEVRFGNRPEDLAMILCAREMRP